MAILFSDHESGARTVKHAPNIVLGWIVSNGEFETRYALLQSGLVLESSPVKCHTKAADSFAAKSWREVATVPAHAEFIGHYENPRG